MPNLLHKKAFNNFSIWQQFDREWD